MWQQSENKNIAIRSKNKRISIKGVFKSYTGSSYAGIFLSIEIIDDLHWIRIHRTMIELVEHMDYGLREYITDKYLSAGSNSGLVATCIMPPFSLITIRVYYCSIVVYIHIIYTNTDWQNGQGNRICRLGPEYNNITIIIYAPFFVDNDKSILLQYCCL